jgi:Protein of unknown function (DUF3071)
MQNLSFVGLSDDGTALILAATDDSRFRLAIDERLRSATRGGRAHMDVSEGPVTAKAIQARLRAGATPNEVADYSGWTVDRVEAFAAPILQERGWVAQRAQKCPIGRGEEDPTLGDLVDQRLGERGIDIDSTRWDAWRREDGMWTVLLAYPAGKGDRVATWLYDMEASSLSAEDDEARWLTEARIPAEARPRLIRVTDDDSPEPNLPREAGSHGNHPAGRAAPPQPPVQQPRLESPSEPVEPEGPRWDEVLFGSPTDERNR